jgi:hypothetical protein
MKMHHPAAPDTVSAVPTIAYIKRLLDSEFESGKYGERAFWQGMHKDEATIRE